MLRHARGKVVIIQEIVGRKFYRGLHPVNDFVNGDGLFIQPARVERVQVEQHTIIRPTGTFRVKLDLAVVIVIKIGDHFGGIGWRDIFCLRRLFHACIKPIKGKRQRGINSGGLCFNRTLLRWRNRCYIILSKSAAREGDSRNRTGKRGQNSPTAGTQEARFGRPGFYRH